MAAIAPPRPNESPAPAPKGLGTGPRPPGVITDQVFRWVALASGLLVLAILGLIAYTTTKNAWPWFRAEGFGIFADNWDPAQHQFGAGAMIYGTFLVGLIALLISVPISIGIALFVTEIAPRRLAKPIVYSVDLLAAIPSVVYGLWALYVLAQSPRQHLRRHLVGDLGHPGDRRSHRRPEPYRVELHDLGDHRGHHGHADHHVAHP